MTIAVRVAGPGDGERIADAWLSAGAYYTDLDPGYCQTPAAQELAELWNAAVGTDDPASLALVAECNGRVVGWLLARYWPGEGDEPSQDSASRLAGLLMVDLLVVERSHWRQGAGAALMNAAEAWGSAQGARVARLATDASSPVSVPFYEQRMGYRRHTLILQKRLPPSDP